MTAAADRMLAAWPRDIRSYVSASSLTMMMRCPEQWRQRYVLDRKEAPRSDLIWGTAHHGALEANYAQKVTSQRDLPVVQVVEEFERRVDERLEEVGGPGGVDWKAGQDGEALTRDTLLARGSELVRLYQERVAPRVQPLTVERSFSVDVGLPVPVQGRIDLEAHVVDPLKPQPKWREANECRQCGRDIALEGLAVVARGLCPWCAGDRIIDFKTAGKNQVQPDNWIQASVYQLERPLPVEIQLAIKPGVTKAGKPTGGRVVHGEHFLPVQPRQRTLGMVERTMRLIAFYLATYAPGEPWDGALRDSWACNYCGFGPKAANLCHWHRVDPWPEELF